MTVPINSALAAYSQAAGKGTLPGMDARDQQGGDFASMLKQASEKAIDNLQQGETVSLQAAAGKADMNNVVVAVSKAELTLQTVVTIRDRAIQSYQDILRMPI
jgi:flagellar hook-basal body complex protein FliE|tara:strand:- start:4606 stop:4914 length:309 start_codon:yes stop_codon:yes gene_type:complete